VGNYYELVVICIGGDMAKKRAPIGLASSAPRRCVLWNITELLDMRDHVDRPLIGKQKFRCLVRAGEATGGDTCRREVDTEVGQTPAENGTIGDRHRLPVFGQVRVAYILGDFDERIRRIVGAGDFAYVVRTRLAVSDHDEFNGPRWSHSLLWTANPLRGQT
jgi:hypothetical protein